MPKRPLSTDRAPRPAGPYSQAVAGGGFVFLAGQGPTAPDGSRVDGSFEEQARQTFSNLRALAEAEAERSRTPSASASTYGIWRTSPR